MSALPDPAVHDPPPTDDPPLTRREWALVAAFWAGWTLLSVGNRVLDPIGTDGRGAPWGSAFAVAGTEALCWALLTPVLFRLTARAGTAQTPWPVRVGLFGGGGVVVALAVSVLGSLLRHAFDPGGGHPGAGLLGGPPGAGSGAVGPGAFGPPGPPPPGDPGDGPPLWFGFLNALVLYLGVLAAGLARAYSLRYRARHDQAVRLQAALADARLDALRRQLDPHFLFNTLNAVSSLVERDPRGVRRMIARLSELLRVSFEGDAAAEVPLRRELALLGRYVEIMQVRFQGRLAVEVRADDAVLDALVPTLILQPLVENAIKHGVERVDGPGLVAVEAAAEGDALVLRVRDNGPGLARPDAAPPERGGVGLRNTVARLEQLYGARQRFTLRDAAGGGTLAEVRLPLRRAAAEVPRAA